MLESEAISLARELMNQHQLGHWVFEFDRAKRRAGCCNHRRQTISLSYHYVQLNGIDEIKDTILHEIAHALAGRGHGHDDYWKAICRQIGAKPLRCCSSNVEMPQGKYGATCGGCQKTFYRHRRPKRQHYCIKCGPVNGLLTYK